MRNAARSQPVIGSHQRWTQWDEKRGGPGRVLPGTAPDLPDALLGEACGLTNLRLGQAEGLAILDRFDEQGLGALTARTTAGDEFQVCHLFLAQLPLSHHAAKYSPLYLSANDRNSAPGPEARGRSI